MLCTLYDHLSVRRWRHLDTCPYRTIIHASPARSDCPEHGALAVKLPWAELNSRFTNLFQALAIDWLSVASQSGVARQLRPSWDKVHAIMDRAVRRGLSRRVAEPMPYLGVEETAERRRNNYLTIVNDLERSRVLYVAQGRTTASLDGFWPTLTATQRDSIQAISVDMWDPFVNSIRANVPDAEIVNFTSPSTWAKPSISCGAARANSYALLATIAWPGRGTTGSSTPTPSSRPIGATSEPCETAT